MWPTWLIAGAQKTGTTSLFELLATHPEVRRPELKEIDYFTWFYHRPRSWYRSFFPLAVGGGVTGEASPSYLYDIRTPARVARDLPEARIIVLLRNPVDRAISHYHHERARGLEPLGLEAALDAEAARLAGERERVRREETYVSIALRHWSYVDRGRYASQLERWLEVVPRDRMLVMFAESLFGHPQQAYTRVLSFLGLDGFAPPLVDAQNANTYTAAPSALRRRLHDVFAQDNERLFGLLGERFRWGLRTAEA